MWQDTKFDAGDEDRVIRKIKDVQWAIVLVCLAILLSALI